MKKIQCDVAAELYGGMKRLNPGEHELQSNRGGEIGINRTDRSALEVIGQWTWGAIAIGIGLTLASPTVYK